MVVARRPQLISSSGCMLAAQIHLMLCAQPNKYDSKKAERIETEVEANEEETKT